MSQIFPFRIPRVISNICFSTAHIIVSRAASRIRGIPNDKRKPDERKCTTNRRGNITVDTSRISFRNSFQLRNIWSIATSVSPVFLWCDVRLMLSVLSCIRHFQKRKLLNYTQKLYTPLDAVVFNGEARGICFPIWSKLRQHSLNSSQPPSYETKKGKFPQPVCFPHPIPSKNTLCSFSKKRFFVNIS